MFTTFTKRKCKPGDLIKCIGPCAIWSVSDWHHMVYAADDGDFALFIGRTESSYIIIMINGVVGQVNEIFFDEI